jgi:hypothetical protein
MRVAFVLALGILTASKAEPRYTSRTTVNRLTTPSKWELEFLEKDGKTRKTSGKMRLERDGTGMINIFPYAPWTIRQSRITSAGDTGTIELDISWEGPFAGRATHYGVYRFIDDRLWLCIELEGRPTDFVTRPDDCRTLLVLKWVGR